MKDKVSHIIAVICLGTLLPTCPAAAFGRMIFQFSLDFTNPTDLANKATWSSPSKHIQVTEKGLTKDGPETSSAEIRIQVTEPIAVGWSWCPVRAVGIAACVNPPGKFTFRQNHTIFPSGELYARHSPDAVHWSDWQYFRRDIPKDQNEPKQTYSGALSIPYCQRQHYQQLLRDYQKLDLPSINYTEESAVKWIFKNDPNFFEKHAPFIGYVQFLYEASLKGGDYIEAITFDMNYMAGGRLANPPKGEDMRKRWRFRTAQIQEDKKARMVKGSPGLK